MTRSRYGLITETGTGTIESRNGALIVETTSSAVTHAATGAITSGSAVVSGSATHLVLHESSGDITADSATVSGAANRSGSATVHAASGSLAASNASFSGAATRLVSHSSTGALSASSSTLSGTANHSAAGAGTIVTPALKNNTGTALASISGWAVNVYNSTTGALVVRKTGLTTDSSGVLTIYDALIVAGTTYSYEPVHSTYGRRLPTALAA